MRNLLVNQDRTTFVTLACLFILFVAGGGGDAAPSLAGVVQAVVAVMFAIWLMTLRADEVSPPLATYAVAALVLALPLLQMMPLPPAVWHGMPGRELMRESLALVGAADDWRPLSLFPFETLAVLMTLVPAVIMLFLASSLRSSGRLLLLILIVFVALLALAVGAVQVSGADGNVMRFYNANSAILSGFQSNRSGQADIFLIAIVCVGAVTRELYPKEAIASRRWRFLLLNASAGLLFALAVVLTRSRFGMIMVPLALLLQMAFLRSALNLSRRALVVGGGVLALCAFGGLALIGNIPKIGLALSRFTTTVELRPEIWKDTLYLTHKYAPWGSGMGTFEPVFQLDERLDWLGYRIINRAHCDFLELYLEGGIPAVVILALVVMIVAWAAVKGLRQTSGPGQWQIWCALWSLCLIGAHSALDYPLRSMSVEAIFAVMVAIILCGARPKKTRPELE
ncbi:O-antigen ligase family protein [Novosphingobium sp. KACC 22771]|uniref:O-antigen ligase family protein n=1 Tax=Novosphingobium sp. KACC 22771 TaxID=3025670 RepID=UPI00236617F7|nr:O-antigen ligase family protein [Novosphingobium sp. KACC 22771]WDF72851.1 O-antigen ligase family protein [Novosphingobium sp. KACC 22771]